MIDFGGINDVAKEGELSFKKLVLRWFHDHLVLPQSVEGLLNINIMLFFIFSEEKNKIKVDQHKFPKNDLEFLIYEGGKAGRNIKNAKFHGAALKLSIAGMKCCLSIVPRGDET